MPEAWIQLQCPDCTEHWEENPADLPDPRDELTCEHCGGDRPVSEFTRTTRDFEILQQFHE